jgi:hypothetical protein
VLKFGSIVSLGMALFVLALTSSSLRAQGFSVNLDLAHFADSIVAAYKTWREGAHEDEVQRRKDSVAVLSAHMSRIAATKRNLADFLKDHPLPLPTDSGVCSGRKCEDPDYKERWQNSHIVKSQFEKLDRQISGLQDDLDDIDPTWQRKIRNLVISCIALVTAKDLCGQRSIGTASTSSRCESGCTRKRMS